MHRTGVVSEWLECLGVSLVWLTYIQQCICCSYKLGKAVGDGTTPEQSWSDGFKVKCFHVFLRMFICSAASGLGCGTWCHHRVMWDLSLCHTDFQLLCLGSVLAVRGLTSAGFGLSCSAGVRDPCSVTSDPTHTPCIARQFRNHWTVKEVPQICFIVSLFSVCLST